MPAVSTTGIAVVSQAFQYRPGCDPAAADAASRASRSARQALFTTTGRYGRSDAVDRAGAVGRRSDARIVGKDRPAAGLPTTSTPDRILGNDGLAHSDSPGRELDLCWTRR